ncbi:CHC2 zinc finger domain-containing protein [Sphingomonas sp. TZW2008]|uniref:CHC2 zinc finger domain-containing protein n=1 Tax=Sphingomonas sp. TZW2008 TaxID=1917973 RepID=UPI00211AA24A|nr:CHC2 zinc finger domain-containing protein [Sphingomonas sp. TZW2008]
MAAHARLGAFASICSHLSERFPVSGVARQTGVKLVRAGRELKGCCPFHPDKTPSFTIYADDRRFQCFGCGAEGDVLDFVQRAYSARSSLMTGKCGPRPRRHVPAELVDERDPRAGVGKASV